MLWIRNDFFSDPDPTFQLVSDPTKIFSDILDTNFTFVFLPWKCVRLLIMTRYKLFKGIFFWQKGIYFLNWASFCWEISNFYQFFRGSFTSNSFWSWSCSDPELFFLRIRILLKVSYPTGSGSTTLLILSARSLNTWEGLSFRPLGEATGPMASSPSASGVPAVEAIRPTRSKWRLALREAFGRVETIKFFPLLTCMFPHWPTCIIPMGGGGGDRDKFIKVC